MRASGKGARHFGCDLWAESSRYRAFRGIFGPILLRYCLGMRLGSSVALNSRRFLKLTLFLEIAFGLSLLLILSGYLMDLGAILGGVDGANGLPIFMMTMISFVGSFPVALIAWIFGGWGYAWPIFLGTVPYHLGLVFLLVKHLEFVGRRRTRARERRSRY